jgi:hypothetical protein
MIKPNFFIIGAAKCATTSLASFLAAHPQAAIVKDKEPHFFSVQPDTRSAYENYLSHYEHCSNEIAIGDASTSYSRIRKNPNTIRRIHDFDPEAKIIYMVRHPLERIESAYTERIMATNVQHKKSLSQSVRQIPMMVDSSRYWEVFDAYRKTFPEKNIMVVWFEEFIQNQQQVFESICRFLGIKVSTEIDSQPQHSNSRAAKEKLLVSQGQSLDNYDTQWDADTRAYVINELREDNLQLLRHFNKGDDYWGDIFN